MLNSAQKTLTLRQSPSNDMLQNNSFMAEITENVANQSPWGKLHWLFDSIKHLVNVFSLFKKTRLRHLHKRTNPGSAFETLVFEIWLYTAIHLEILSMLKDSCDPNSLSLFQPKFLVAIDYIRTINNQLFDADAIYKHTQVRSLKFL